jgi:hypothetical protein
VGKWPDQLISIAENSPRVGEFSAFSAMLISWSGRPELSIARGNRNKKKVNR